MRLSALIQSFIYVVGEQHHAEKKEKLITLSGKIDDEITKSENRDELEKAQRQLTTYIKNLTLSASAKGSLYEGLGIKLGPVIGAVYALVIGSNVNQFDSGYSLVWEFLKTTCTIAGVAVIAGMTLDKYRNHRNPHMYGAQIAQCWQRAITVKLQFLEEQPTNLKMVSCASTNIKPW